MEVDQLLLQHRWSTAVVLLLLVPVFTFITTSLISWAGFHSRREGREPPLKPYWIPLLGDWYGFILHPKNLLESVCRRYGNYTSVTVRLGPAKAYIMLQPQTFAPLLRDYKKCTNKMFSVLTMQQLCGTPRHGLGIYKNDNSSIGVNPLPGTNVPPHLRIWRHQHESNHRFLQGANLKEFHERIVQNLSAELASVNPSDPIDSGEWATHSDFYTWWTHKLMTASITAMCGPHMLRLNPEFIADFWVYMDAWPTLSKFYPRWLAPAAYTARDRVVKAIMVWHAYARQHSDCRVNGPTDPSWDEYWGSTWLKVRQQWGQDSGKMDHEVLACEDLALIVAAHANVMPSCFWNLVEIYSDPDLLARLQPVLDACIDRSQSDNRVPSLPLRFDTNPALSSPLAQSVYAEVQRMRVSMFHNRSPSLVDYRLGPFTLRKGALVMVPTAVASNCTELWGKTRTSRPLDVFWADRFLVMEKKQESAGEETSDSPLVQNALKPEEEPVRFSTEGLDGAAWIPYGGGAFTCPGRHLAKLEIISSAALFAAYFDLELVNGVPPMDDRFFGLGTQPPRGKVPVRIRRKLGALKPAVV
ncbi:hypothetical protein M406DRAFT_76074 [Cryphonectria parasitica EP155]|uniref:Cytochrome P450 n=1 Tax=Cryphonectria parasitica (strain ATCC 38755 / EP155) TaxID=660469 RepID=A0A9P4XSH9_CRYP1|nr:uncharacterized protein M406DRAFT_76074 [Cryphonectria parasitica EP155]KAF3760417.1 hypothetical protein M406DRAFT_76074 [Cryphonectria parasitica EP155]